MNVRHAVLAFWLLTLVYVGALLSIDHEKGLTSSVAHMHVVLPILMLLLFLGLLSMLVLELAPAKNIAQASV